MFVLARSLVGECVALADRVLMGGFPLIAPTPIWVVALRRLGRRTACAVLWGGEADGRSGRVISIGNDRASH
jgi:hypothetical protein